VACRDVHALEWASASPAGAVRRLTAPTLDHALRGVARDRASSCTGRTERPSNVLRAAGSRTAFAEDAAPRGARGRADGARGFAAAGRTIAWSSDEAWAARSNSSLKGPLGRIAHRDRPIAQGIAPARLAMFISPPMPRRSTTRCSWLRAAAIAATSNTFIDRPSLELLGSRGAGAFPTRGPPEGRASGWPELLLAGRPRGGR